MYAALAALPGISYLSVGHRPSLERFHRSRLRLLGTEPSQANRRSGSGPSPSYKLIATEKLRRMREVKRRRSEARRRRSDAANASSAS